MKTSDFFWILKTRKFINSYYSPIEMWLSLLYDYEHVCYFLLSTDS